MNGKKWPRYFAILVVLAMLVETISFTLTSYAKNDTNAEYELANEDKTTISDISNMTGVKADEIIKLREAGKTWNEILELIKNNPDYKAEGDSTKRSNTLTKTNMDEDTVKKLKEEGFTEEQIIEAKSLVERVIFQLEEIANMQVAAPLQPEDGVTANEVKEENLTAYVELSGKINLNEAVYLILKLGDELGSMQAVLDEYLCSLQLDIDLNQYLINKEEYEMQKQQKLAEMLAQDIITTAGIDEKMLDMLQSKNKKAEENLVVKTYIPTIPDTVIESPLPDVQAPEALEIKPQNPAEAILQEIEGLKNNGVEQDGR
jgi:hypothetical protein